MYIVDRPRSLVGFFDLLRVELRAGGCICRMVSFFFASFPFLFCTPVGPTCICHVYYGFSLGIFGVNLYVLLPIKKVSCSQLI